jgi:hypothetical protein
MKRLSILLVLCLALPLTARADEASRRVKAQEMITLLHLDRLVQQLTDGMMKQVSAMSKQQFAGHDISAAQQAQLDDFQKQVFALIDTQLGWKAMEPTYVDIYAKTLTDDELDGIIAFYKSPAGTAMIEKLPRLTTQAQQIVQQKMVTLQPQIMQLVQDFASHAAAPSK